MHSQQFFTKKDLERIFNITYRTVYRTIQAAGLQTSKRFYNRYEVTRLAEARSLFKAGKTAQEVRQYFLERTRIKQIEQV